MTVLDTTIDVEMAAEKPPSPRGDSPSDGSRSGTVESLSTPSEEKATVECAGI